MISAGSSMKRILTPAPVNPAAQAGSTFIARRCHSCAGNAGSLKTNPPSDVRVLAFCRNCVCATRIVRGAGEAGSAPGTARLCGAVCAAHGRHTKVAIEAITIFNDKASNFLHTNSRKHDREKVPQATPRQCTARGCRTRW